VNKILFALTIACLTNLNATEIALENKIKNFNIKSKTQSPEQNQEEKQNITNKNNLGEQKLVDILNFIKKDKDHELKNATIKSLKDSLKTNYTQLKELSKESDEAQKDKETVNKILKELISNKNNPDKYSYKKLFINSAKNIFTTKYGLICFTVMVALAQVKGILTSQVTLEIFKEIRYSLRWISLGSILKNVFEGIVFAVKAKFATKA